MNQTLLTSGRLATAEAVAVTSLPKISKPEMVRECIYKGE